MAKPIRQDQHQTTTARPGRRPKACLWHIESDIRADIPVTDAELTAIERLLGSDLATLLGGDRQN